MYIQKLDLTKALALVGDYDGVKAYAQHKRAQVILSGLFARALARPSAQARSGRCRASCIDAC